MTRTRRVAAAALAVLALSITAAPIASADPAFGPGRPRRRRGQLWTAGRQVPSARTDQRHAGLQVVPADSPSRRRALISGAPVVVLMGTRRRPRRGSSTPTLDRRGTDRPLFLPGPTARQGAPSRRRSSARCSTAPNGPLIRVGRPVPGQIGRCGYGRRPARERSPSASAIPVTRLLLPRARDGKRPRP